MTASSSGQGDFAQPLSDRVQQPTVNVSGFTPAAGSVADAQVATAAKIAQTKIASSLGKADLSADVGYLHGDAGLIELVNDLKVDGTLESVGVASLAWNGSAYAVTVGTDGNLSGTAIKANGMRVQRHPYSNDEHTEHGHGTTNASKVLDVTFTDAYASAPDITFGSDGSALAIGYSARSATGFTATSPGTSDSFSWIAIGTD